MADEEVSLLVQLQDEASRGLDQIGDASDKMESQVSGASDRAGKAQEDLGRKTEESAKRSKRALGDTASESERSSSRIVRALGGVGRTLRTVAGAPFRGLAAAARGSMAQVRAEVEKSRATIDRFKGLIKGGLGIGAAFAVGSVFKGGIDRALNIEDARAKLSGLGNDAKTVQTIMDNALASVKGTAYGLGDAATVAAGASAAGVKPGKDLQKTLTLVADSASIAGIGMNEMGSMFNKVAASDKIQGDVLAQLSDAGIPIVSLLSKTMHKSSAEVVALASKGKINFKMFQNAMQKGLGGAAQKSSQTFRGAWANLKTAMARIGANVMTPILGALREAFVKITPMIDQFGKAIGPAVDAFAKGLGPALKTVGHVLGIIAPYIAPLVAGFIAYKAVMLPIKVATMAWAAAQMILNAVMKANPLGLIIAGVTALIAGFVLMYKRVGWFKDFVDGAFSLIKAVVKNVVEWFKTAVPAAWEWIKAAAANTVNAIVAAWNWLVDAGKNTVNALVAAWQWVRDAWNNTVNFIVSYLRSLVDFYGGGITFLWQVVSTVFTNVKNFIVSVWGSVVSWISEKVNFVRAVWQLGWQQISSTVSAVWSAIRNTVTGAARAVVGFIVGALSTIRSYWSTAWGAVSSTLSTAWRNITSGVSNGIGRMIGFFSGLWGRITGAVGDIASRAYNFGKGIIDHIIDGIKNSIGRIGSVIGDGVGGAINGAKSLFGFSGGGVVPGFAGGGTVPGYAPGRDSVLAALSPGEGVLVPEAVRALGSDWLYAINKHYSGGRSPGAPNPGVGGGLGGAPVVVSGGTTSTTHLNLTQSIGSGVSEAQAYAAARRGTLDALAERDRRALVPSGRM